MCSNFLGIEGTLAKKINMKDCNFFSVMLPHFHIQKVSAHCKEQNKKIIMTIGQKTKKLFKVKKW